SAEASPAVSGQGAGRSQSREVSRGLAPLCYFTMSLTLFPTFSPARSIAFPAFSKGPGSQAARTRATPAAARILQDCHLSFIGSLHDLRSHDRTRPLASPMTRETRK